MAALVQLVVRADNLVEGDQVSQYDKDGNHQLLAVRAELVEHPEQAEARAVQANTMRIEDNVPVQGAAPEQVVGSAPQAVVLYVAGKRQPHELSPSDLLVVWR